MYICIYIYICIHIYYVAHDWIYVDYSGIPPPPKLSWGLLGCQQGLHLLDEVLSHELHSLVWRKTLSKNRGSLLQLPRWCGAMGWQQCVGSKKTLVQKSPGNDGQAPYNYRSLFAKSISLEGSFAKETWRFRESVRNCNLASNNTYNWLYSKI